MALENQGRIMEAVKVYRQAESGHEATLNLGRLLRSLGRAAEAVAVYDASPVADPEIAENRLFALLYDAKKSKEEVAKAHIEWGVGELNKNPHAEERSVSKHASNPKLGFLSPDLRTHSVAYFVLPVLEACAKLGIPTVCYSDTAVPDAMTARLKRAAGKWRDIAGKPDALVAEMIRADGLSALFDLAGHTAGGRMGVLARKPVPVQAGWIGYPHPSGLPTVDYFITDELCAPPGLDGLYAPEKLLRLPGPFSCYAPPADLPEPGPLPEGSTVFVSFNNMAKMSDAVVTTWAALLRRAPDSTLLLKSWQFADPDVRTETMARFAVHHVDPSRLRLVGNLPSAIQHLSLYGQAHVALDTFPYNGTTTTCEALWMGLPVVSLAGDSHLSRVGVSLLTHAGFPEWIAKTPESYVEVALDLAQDRTRLAGLRGGQMRARLTASALSDAMALVRGLIQRLS
ncbi:MAG: hypothetical protein A2516_04400 [Alphaproteobacteria bacterium RIFOXYD12_FULL_60_8]|nr:MAG: hypothetical protein A2516_04400 [Alphaproteobacteria bacterium RIFOXYD12_FULL_60_8]